MGGRSIACLNARDRNLLGFQRDLLTAEAYGVDQFLLVRGDEPRVGGRTSELTVRTMLKEARAFESTLGFAAGRKLRLGAATGLGDLPAWKQEADFLFVQVGFSLEALLRWNERVKPQMAVYGGSWSWRALRWRGALHRGFRTLSFRVARRPTRS